MTSLLLYLLVCVVALAAQRPPAIASDCPLDLSLSNFSLATSVCSGQNEKGKCCRYINALIAVSVVQYASSTGYLGVPTEVSEVCLSSISHILQQHGVPSDAMLFCGLGTKILVNYQCEGRTTVLEMLQSPNFTHVVKNCKASLSVLSNCRRCLNAGIAYVHHLIGTQDNITLSTCRDATVVTLASKDGNISTDDIGSCFFGVRGLMIHPANVTGPSVQEFSPMASPKPPLTKSPSQHVTSMAAKEHHGTFHLTLVSEVGIGIIGIALALLSILLLLIYKKNRELKDSAPASASWDDFTPIPVWKFQEGSPPVFQTYSYKETKRATNNFSSVIEKGGYGTVYKAEFGNGQVVAVKKIEVSKQSEDDFCRIMELLGRLHHRHLVALKGFCVGQHKRFLMYEYMENGSLKDHLHSSERTLLSWQKRIQIARDVANALEYLHVYCDPPLCHRDIKASNILLGENFIAKVADFGLAYISQSDIISSGPTDINPQGTPGYTDPEYANSQELAKRTDILSYGMLLLELVTGRHVVQDREDLVEWSQNFMVTYSRIPELVDPQIKDSVDLEQLQVIVDIVQWCTQSEWNARPSIKQVLLMLYERLDPAQHDFARAIANDAKLNNDMAHPREVIPQGGGDARCLQSSSSTSRSCCSRSFLLEGGSPQSPSKLSL